MKRFSFRRGCFGLAALIGAMLFVVGSRPAAAAPKPDEVKKVAAKAFEYLKSKQQADGSFVPKFGPGVTAIVAAALAKHGYGGDPVVAKALESLEKHVQKDGGIYSKGLANYLTCVSIIAFKENNKGGKYDAIIANAAKFLKGLQGGGDQKDTLFGGVGYDGKGGADLSNTAFFVEALISAGVPKDDPAIKNVLIFISRCQNQPSEIQKTAWAAKTSADDKGGFVYNPLADQAKGKDGKKSDRVTAAGGLRSEGGMTYSGLKSFLYAGVGKDDERVKAAIAWIQKHYTLEENPGMKDNGLFYYYHVFAKAMNALGDDQFTDAAMKKHDWRQELFDTLKKKQAADGSWVNSNPGFGEGSPELATAFALLALSYTGK